MRTTEEGEGEERARGRRKNKERKEELRKDKIGGMTRKWEREKVKEGRMKVRMKGGERRGNNEKGTRGK